MNEKKEIEIILKKKKIKYKNEAFIESCLSCTGYQHTKSFRCLECLKGKSQWIPRRDFIDV